MRTTRAPSCRVESTQGSGVVALSHKLWLFLRISVRRPLAPVTFTRARRPEPRDMSPAETEHAPRGSTRVVCRVRPLGSSERGSCVGTCGAEVTLAGSPSFSFDAVFPPTASNDAGVRRRAPTLEDVRAGINGAVLAYGQSGAGKSHTMNGGPGDPGVVQRVRARPNLLSSRLENVPPASAVAVACPPPGPRASLRVASFPLTFHHPLPRNDTRRTRRTRARRTRRARRAQAITDLVSHRDERVLAGETCRLTFSALELYNERLADLMTGAGARRRLLRRGLGVLAPRGRGPEAGRVASRRRGDPAGR